jgi:site-specific DNA-methyltransferase (cytosine-N4-specific)
MTMTAAQIELFEHVTDAFSQPRDGRLTNREVYRIAAGRAGISQTKLDAQSAIGKAGSMRREIKHRIRWMLNSLKTCGVIPHVAGERGVWELTEAGRSKLRKIRPDVSWFGHSTDLDRYQARKSYLPCQSG